MKEFKDYVRRSMASGLDHNQIAQKLGMDAKAFEEKLEEAFEEKKEAVVEKAKEVKTIVEEAVEEVIEKPKAPKKKKPAEKIEVAEVPQGE